MQLKIKEINSYQRDGVVVIKKAISEYWIKKIISGIQKNFLNPSKYKCVYEKVNNIELFYDDYCNWQRIEEYKDFIFNSKIANIASQLMESRNVNLFHEHVLIKEAGAKKHTPWHQDQSYYCVKGNQNVSFWIPLDKILKHTCPEFITGSHKWNQKFLPTKFFGESYNHIDKEFEKIPDIENNRMKYKILASNLNIGDIIAFNFATVHGAPGNVDKTRRRAFSVRFTGDDARYIKRKGEMSPPFPEVKLKNGDKMDSQTFPLINYKN